MEGKPKQRKVIFSAAENIIKMRIKDVKNTNIRVSKDCQSGNFLFFFQALLPFKLNFSNVLIIW